MNAHKCFHALLVLLNALLFLTTSATEQQQQQPQFLTLVGTVDGNVHAIDQHFQKVWSTSVGDPMIKSSTSMKLNSRYSNVIPSLDGTILFQNTKGIKRSPFKSRVAVDLSPSLARDGLIHVGTKNCKLFCVNLVDGSMMSDLASRDLTALQASLAGDSSRNYGQSVPFWLGRLDYRIEGMNPSTGEEEFAVTYSELEPLQTGGIGEVSSATTSAVQKFGKQLLSTTQIASQDLPHQAMFTDILSSPEGEILFVDDEGEPCYEEPIYLGSPPMNAFLLNIDADNSARLIRRLNVRYGINDLKTLHRLRSNNMRTSTKSLPSSDNVILIHSSTTESGSEFYYGMEVINSKSVPSPPLMTPDNKLPLPSPSQPLSSIKKNNGLKSPLKPVHATNRNIKSIRNSGTFSYESIFNDSTLLTKPEYRKPVKSITGFHRLTQIDEELWLDELLHDAHAKSRSILEPNAIEKLPFDAWISRMIAVSLLLCVVLLIVLLLQSRKAVVLPVAANISPPLESVKQPSNTHKVGSLVVHSTIIGYGSHGTVVFKGSLFGRAVAVKRMLAQFNNLANREISMLIKSDGHPNVVRYFVKEERNDFVYLGLQLCDCNLKDLIGKLKLSQTEEDSKLKRVSSARLLLLQVAQGLQYLHNNKIVHRDLKPHNILCSHSDSLIIQSSIAYADLEKVTLKISDMGFSKLLDDGNSFSTLSIHDTTKESVAHQFEPVGTIGWQAPEMIVDRNYAKVDSANQLEPEVPKKTLSVDIFSLGCIFFYVLTLGGHPFGEWYEREANIVNNKLNLDMLLDLPDALNLIQLMLHPNPTHRLTAGGVCEHYFFWPSSVRLDYLTQFSDKLEQESPDAAVLMDLQSKASIVFQIRWDREISGALLEDSGKYRKYDPYSVADLLRLIRNKKNHFHELPPQAKLLFSSFPNGLYDYFQSKFPQLLGVCIAVEHQLAANAKHCIVESQIELQSIDSIPLQNSNSKSVVLWQDSALHNKLKCQGWWRDAGEWTDMLSYSSSSKKKSKSNCLIRIGGDKKFRTKLCSHWEASCGDQCPMRRKAKCVFAHGLVELRVKISRNAESWSGIGASY